MIAAGKRHAVLPGMNTFTWVIAGAGAGYILLLAWLIRRHRHDPVQQQADRGIREIEKLLGKQETPGSA